MAIKEGIAAVGLLAGSFAAYNVYENETSETTQPPEVFDETDAQELINDAFAESGTQDVTETSTTLTARELSQAEREDIANELNSFFVGFNQGDVVLGDAVSAEADTAEERGSAAFEQESIRLSNYREDITNLLTTNEVARATVVRNTMESLHNMGVAPTEIKDVINNQILNGIAFVPAQMLVESAYSGMTYLTEDGLAVADGERRVGAGDVIYMAFVDITLPDGSNVVKLLKSVNIREDCQNPGAESVRPIDLNNPDDTSIPPMETGPVKFDEGELPGDGNVPADQDPGTPDVAGNPAAGVPGALPEEGGTSADAEVNPQTGYADEFEQAPTVSSTTTIATPATLPPSNDSMAPPTTANVPTQDVEDVIVTTTLVPGGPAPIPTTTVLPGTGMELPPISD